MAPLIHWNKLFQNYQRHRISQFCDNLSQNYRRPPKGDSLRPRTGMKPGEPLDQRKVVAGSKNGSSAEFLRQAVAEIPWGQNLVILNKVKEPAARLWYLQATAQFGWSRNVLLNQIKAAAYDRAVKEKKTHNFAIALPEHMAEQADEMLKSTYSLDFLGLTKAVKERELEDRLITRLQAFLLELGYGFQLASPNSKRPITS